MRASIILVFMVLMPSIAYAEGIGVSPSSLELTYGKGQTLHLFNPNGFEASFFIESDEKIALSENEGRIDANGRKSITVQSAKNEDFASKLKIHLTSQEEEGFSIGSGVNIEVNSHARESGHMLPYWAIILSIALVCIFVMLLILR